MPSYAVVPSLVVEAHLADLDVHADFGNMAALGLSGLDRLDTASNQDLQLVTQVRPELMVSVV